MNSNKMNKHDCNFKKSCKSFKHKNELTLEKQENTKQKQTTNQTQMDKRGEGGESWTFPSFLSKLTYLGHFPLQHLDFFGTWKCHVQARWQGVVEINAALLCTIDQFFQALCSLNANHYCKNVLVYIKDNWSQESLGRKVFQLRTVLSLNFRQWNYMYLKMTKIPQKW